MKILITGSTDGIGLMAAERLIKQGNEVLLHARNKQRADVVLQKLPKALGVVVGDLSGMSQTKSVAEQANGFGVFDSIIHNAAVGYQEKYIKTEDGLPHVFAINSLAPYLLTCLMEKPKRLIYTSSGLHEQGDASLNDIIWEKKKWNGLQAYADTKLQDVLLAFAVARHLPDVFCNVVSPGWVATKMGGRSAPESLEEAPETQIWLASSNEKEVQVSGKYFYHKKLKPYLHNADNVLLQDKFIEMCASVSGIKLFENE